jgi:hypothetical protein
MDYKMKRSLLLAVLLASVQLEAGENTVKSDPIAELNRVRMWSSYTEVIEAHLALPQSERSPVYGFGEQWAVAEGLRAVGRVLDSAKAEKLDAVAIAAAITANRSIVDIAITGEMISLGETASYPTGKLAEQLQLTYKTKEIASDVASGRKNALKALEVLLKLKIAGQHAQAATP